MKETKEEMMKSIIKKIPYLSVILLLFIILPGDALSQRFSITEVDPSGFPTIRASFNALKALELPYDDLTKDDFNVTEDGVSMNHSVQVVCVTKEINPEVSVLLVLDQSSSMDYKDTVYNERRWLWVQEGAESFINTIKMEGRTAIAVTSFGYSVWVRCPFTNDKEQLLEAIDTIRVGGDTRYDPPFLHFSAGADTLLRTRPTDMRRIVVFLTDGQPYISPSTDSIITRLNDANIQVYSITLTMPMNKDLAKISAETGGRSFAVYTKEQLSEIYTLIALDIQSKQFCDLTWEAPYGCTELSRYREVQIKFLRQGDSPKVRRYVAPVSSIATVGTSESIVTFGNPDPGDSTIRSVTITPQITPLIVTDVKVIPPTFFEIIDYGGSENPPNSFVVDTGESRTLTVKFTQQDDLLYRQASLLFEGEPCPPVIALVGGLFQVIVVKPNGAEIFSICDTVEIIWAGVEPNIPVKLSYTLDNGNTWSVIANAATGLSYRWLPTQEGTEYRIKAEVSDIPMYLWATKAGGIENDKGKSLAVFDSTNKNVYVTGLFEDRADFDDEFISSVRGTDVFVAKYDFDGNFIWVEKGGSSGNDSASGATVDPFNNVYITGTCFSGMQFGNIFPSIQEEELPYCFVARYLPTGGTPLVNVEIGASGVYTRFEAWGEKIRVDNGIIYVSGQYIGGLVTAGGYSLPNADNPTVFTAEFDGNLRLQKLERDGNNYPDYSTTNDYDLSGNRYQTGSFEDTLTVGRYKVVSAGKKDIYIHKYGITPGSEDISDSTFTVEAPVLTLAPSSVNLGDCVIGSSVSKIFNGILENTGSLPIEIISTQMTGNNPNDFTLVSNLTGAIIQPGTKAFIEIDFSPNAIGNRSAQLEITPFCGDPVTLQISGNGVCSGEVVTPIDMGKSNLGIRKDSTINCIFKNTNKAVIVISPVIEGDNPGDFRLYFTDFSNVTSDIPVDGDSCMSFIVSFIPSFPGDRNAIINFNLPQGCENPHSELIGYGIDADITVKGVDWGEKRVLTVNNDKVIINNNGLIQQKINEITFETTPGSEFSMNIPSLTDPIPAGDSLEIPITFTPSLEQLYINTVRVVVEDLQDTLRAGLRGVGILPKIETSWVCDTAVKPGNSSTAILYVKNPSESSVLYVESIDFVPPAGDFTWIGNAPRDITIQKNDEEKFTIIFQPQIPGSHSVDIIIKSDAVTGPEPIEMLETIVTGACEALGISMQTPIDFGALLLCDSDTEPIRISNTGGSTAITISDYYFTGEDSTAFSVLIPPDFLIPAGDVHEFYVTFTPAEPKNYTCTLHLSNSINQELNAELTGSGHIIHLYTPEKLIRKEPGFMHKLPVEAEIISLEKVNIDKFTFQLLYNENMLRYIDNSISNKLQNWSWDTPQVGNGIVEISGSGVLQTPFKGELLTLDFEVFLGDIEKSDVFFKPIFEPCVTQDTLGATFVLTDVCFLAGRLIKVGNANYILSQPKPNPASGQVNIQFGVGLDGFTKINLINALGSFSKTIVNENLKSGYYELTLSTESLPQGIYIIILQSGQFYQSRKLIISK